VNRLRRKKWRLLPDGEDTAESLRSALGCSPLAARLLVNRGITTPEEAEAFLYPSYDHLCDPFLLPDAELAAERIKQALRSRERIFVHGDYDSDGVTSAALWTRLLEKLGADVSVHVPHRHRDGYDLRSNFIAQARQEGFRLIITTDCGIQRVEEVEEARAAGLDVIITDHHEPGEELPKATAVVNPHRADSSYPFKNLAGVGVAFRTGEALVRHLGLSVDAYRRAYCDLAAIGTVTDIMPILGDNRVFVKHGLAALQETKKPGLRALIASAGLSDKPLTVFSIGFQIGPRINAIGRMDDAKIALDLLLTRDPAQAADLAAQLERANTKRREEEQRTLAEAMQEAAQCDIAETACLVLSSATWHGGVIGLVANKVVEAYHRPAILVALDAESGMGHGSARSIRAFNMFEAITACGAHLIEFGGHALAAGFSIAADELPAFASAMNQVAWERLTEEDFLPSLDVDAEVDAAEVTPALLRELRMFEPWGRGNDPLLLVSRGLCILDVKRIGKDMNHLKLLVRSDGMNPTEALMWRAGDLADHLHPGDSLDLCYRPQFNTFNGRTSIQFDVLDLRPSDADEW
jgi:single-stranded-DNA-specific exonuclease